MGRGGRSALPRLRLGFVFAHGCSVLRTGLRGRALTGRRAFALASLRSVFRLRPYRTLTERSEARPNAARQGRTAAAPYGAPSWRPAKQISRERKNQNRGAAEASANARRPKGRPGGGPRSGL